VRVTLLGMLQCDPPIFIIIIIIFNAKIKETRPSSLAGVAAAEMGLKQLPALPALGEATRAGASFVSSCELFARRAVCRDAARAPRHQPR